jgi:hypothetical protein
MADELADMGCASKEEPVCPGPQKYGSLLLRIQSSVREKMVVKTQVTHCPETEHLTKRCSELWLLSILNEQRNSAAPSSLGRPYIGQTTTRSAHA